MSLWHKAERNVDTQIWEVALPGGSKLRVTGGLHDRPPPDWMVKHHTDRWGNNPPRVELGATGHRYLFPGDTEWREYGYKPKAGH